MRCRACGHDQVVRGEQLAAREVTPGVYAFGFAPTMRCAKCGSDMVEPTPAEILDAAGKPDVAWRFVFTDGRRVLGEIDAVQLVELWASVVACADQVQWTVPDRVLRSAFVQALMLGATIDLVEKEHGPDVAGAMRAALTHLEPFYGFVSSLVQTLAPKPEGGSA